ncbi:hypothetical protein DVH24_039924, partial [Malus domestica]
RSSINKLNSYKIINSHQSAKQNDGNLIFEQHTPDQTKQHQKHAPETCFGPYEFRNNSGLMTTIFSSNKKEIVPFATWDGTERSGTRCSVPRLVCLKRVERAVPRNEFWVNFRSASPPRTTRSTSVEHKIITSLSPSSSSLFPSEGIFAPSSFRPVLSRPIPFRSIPSRFVCIPNDTMGTVPFGTWDGTELSRTRRSVPRLVRLKWVERIGPRDKFWNDLFHVRGTRIYNILRQKYPFSFSIFTPLALGGRNLRLTPSRYD